MKIRKTSINNRETYTYEFSDGSKITLHPGENGLTEADIKQLHSLDDSEVYYNLKYIKPPHADGKKTSESGDAEKNWLMSLDHFYSSDDGDSTIDRFEGFRDPAADLFSNPDEPPKIERLHEIIAELTPKQQKLYHLVVIEGWHMTDIAKKEGVSETAIRHRMSYSGEPYDNDIVRSAVHAIASNAAKLKPSHIRRSDGTITKTDSQLEWLLQYRPNPYMNTYDFIYKTVTQLLLTNNAFIYVMPDEFTGKPQGFYPLNSIAVDLLEAEGDDETVYAKFYFMNGKTVVVPYDDIIHLRRFYYKNDMYGETHNTALTPILQVITKSYSAMSQAEQTTLRYNYLMSVTSMAQGDFARTSGSYANQMRVFQANIESLTVSLGQAVIPLIQAILPWINMFAQALIGAATTFTQWVDSLLGIKAQAAAVTSSASALTSLSDASDSTADSAGNAAKSINAVTTAAKAAKSAVSGIDELNVLQKQTSSNSSSASPNNTGSVISTPSVPIVSIPTAKQNINVGIIGADKIEAFKNACAAAWGWIVKYQDGIKAVASVITIFFLPALIRSTAQLVIASAKGFISGAKAVIEYGLAGWRAVASMVAQAEALATKIALWIAEKVQIVASTIATIAHEAAVRASAAAQFVLSGALWETVAAWVAGKVQIIAGVAAMIAQKAALVASTIATNAAAAAQWLLNAALDANPIGLVIIAVAALIAIFVALWNNNKGFRDFWINAWNSMKAAWNGFSNGIQTVWNTVLKPFGAFLWDLFCTRFRRLQLVR